MACPVCISRSPLEIPEDALWPMTMALAIAARTAERQFESPRICALCGIVYCKPIVRPAEPAASEER
jgi:hypothetical protein